MLETAQALIRRVGQKIGLSKAEIAELLSINAQHRFDITLKNGKAFPAYRIQHNNRRGPYKGGIRFHPNVTLSEVQALAMLMSLKTAALGLPLGGGKGGVAVDPKLLTESELEQLSRAYVAQLVPFIGPELDIPAPDVNTNSQIIDWMVDEYERITGDSSHASFTGKSLPSGGSLGREAATGRGGVFALEALLKHRSPTHHPLTVAIQGFGNVGAFFGLVAETDQIDWRLVAATDSRGGVYDSHGLVSSQLQAHKSDGASLATFPSERSLTNDELLELEVDVLVLAALEDAVTAANMHRVKATIILELANGPLSEQAHDFLYDNGKTIVPDIIANGGGVVVSYLEWLQNRRHQTWDEERINTELKEYVVTALDKAYEYSQQHNVSLKEAAFTLAIHNLRS